MDTLGESWKYDPVYHRLAGFLGVGANKRQENRIAERILYIAQSTKGKDINSILSKVQTLRRKLGISQIGELLVDQLYQSMRLQNDIELRRSKEIAEQEQRAEKKADKIEAEALKKTEEIKVEIEKERMRIKELTELQNQGAQIQGGLTL